MKKEETVQKSKSVNSNTQETLVFNGKKLVDTAINSPVDSDTLTLQCKQPFLAGFQRKSQLLKPESDSLTRSLGHAVTQSRGHDGRNPQF